MIILLELFITIISGIGGPLLGGLIGLKGNKDNLSIAMLLALSLGMMLAMVSFDLLPESLEILSVYHVTFIVSICIVVMLLLDLKVHHHHHLQEDEQSQDLHHHMDVLQHNTSQSFYQLAVMMIISVGLHNFPEGLAIGSNVVHSLNSGLLMALLLMLHNIPEGMGMMVSLLKSNMSVSKALLVVCASGIPTVIGGLCGVVFGNINETIVAVFLSIAAGCMLYVIFFELIPQIHLMANRKKVILCEVVGFIFGFLLIHMMHM